MPHAAEKLLLDGPAGPIEVLVDRPEHTRGLALVAHPHPLLGGANSNKVVYTLAHALRDLGYLALRPNFRGVGRSAGPHDEGVGETEDLLFMLKHAHEHWGAEPRLPVALAGYSFGAFVQTRVARRLADAGQPAEKIVLVAMAVGLVGDVRSYEPEPVPRDSILIHGDRDTTVPLANLVAYAEPLNMPIVLIPGTDHFFHGRLQIIREVVNRAWR